jgi:EAL domain-containing protein (putative c-di-GMP-specific phosphodiesterase class I)
VNTTQIDPQDRLVADLAGAVSRHEIVAYYQPQIDIESGNVVAVESLSRWMHPQLGMQSPLIFIPLAEEFGLIDELGDFMVSEACRLAVDFCEREMNIEVAVNVSALQLASPAFFTHLEQLISDLQLAPGSITLEITESRLIANRPQVAKRLGHLRDLGVGVSIDDFGVGYSQVEQVLALPASDRGLRTVAEGVETEEQLQRVRDLNCDRAQGYLIGMPMPKAQLFEDLARRAA